MDTLRQQVRRARRRLVLQAFAGRLPWTLAATLAVAAVAVAVGKFAPLGDQQLWAAGWLGLAVPLGILAAIGWTWRSPITSLDAAVEIDRRFGLKERVSSSLALGRSESQTPIAQALIRDAAERASRIEIAERFGVRLSRQALLPVIPAVIGCLLAVFVAAPAAQAPAASTTDAAAVKKSTQALAKRLDEKRKQAEEQGLKETDELLASLEHEAQLLSEKQTDKKQSLVALNDLVKDVEKRRQQVAGAAELKQQLSQLKNLAQGPAQKLGQALKAGDLQQAVDELGRLNKALADDKLTADQRQELAKQLAEAQQALEQLAQAHAHAEEELRRQINAERRAGNVEAAERLQQQLDKLAERRPQAERLSRLAEHLKNASKCTAGGQCQQAADALANVGDELAGLEKETDELETLDDALAEVAACKSAMTCKECNGGGCKACQGGMMAADGQQNQPQQGGLPPGRAPGRGVTDDRVSEGRPFDSQVKQQVGKGASLVTGTAGGPNRRGQVRQEINDQYSAAEQESAESLSSQRLPHDYRDHARKYFDSLREGKK